MKKVIAAILLASFLILVSGATGCPQQNADNPEPELIGEKIAEAISDQQVNLSGNVVYMNADGFFPKKLIINTYENVTFYNNDTTAHWPASGIHPTHNSYPISGGCIGSTFDACKGLEPGESFTFEFTLAGQWSYHDHLRPSYGYGTIAVNR